MAIQPFSNGLNNVNIGLALYPTGRYQHCSPQYLRIAIVNQRLYLDAGETRMMIGNDSENVFLGRVTSTHAFYGWTLICLFNYSHLHSYFYQSSV
jgi:hypothetical protein